jgi:uncharacterized protein
MKKIAILISLILVCCSSVLTAQISDYKVVFDLTSKDTNDHKAVIRWLNEVLKSDSAAQLEVVFYGKSLDMIVKDRSVVAESVSKLALNKNISFKVCAIAMKNNQVAESQLLPGVQIIPDGIYEIMIKQKQGWGYIKAKL